MDLRFRPAHSDYKCNAFPTKFQMCSCEIEFPLKKGILKCYVFVQKLNTQNVDNDSLIHLVKYADLENDRGKTILTGWKLHIMEFLFNSKNTF